MSYILDALKKAEADRDPDTRARLAFEQREKRRSHFVTYAVLSALIANAAILLWLFLPDALTEPPAAVSATPVGDGPVAEGALDPASNRPAVDPGAAPPQPVRREAKETSAASAAPVDPSPPAAEPLVAVSTPPRPDPEPLGTGEIRIGPQSTVPSAAAVPLASLPDDSRRRFPTLSFSTHVYADEPDLRAVVVNGRRLAEGDRLGELTLQEITEDGAVFRFEGRSVEVGVLNGWN